MTADVKQGFLVSSKRNIYAIESHRKAIDDAHINIDILYRGGHMVNLGKRLREKFDLGSFRVQWIIAWSIIKQDLQFFIPEDKDDFNGRYCFEPKFKLWLSGEW